MSFLAKVTLGSYGCGKGGQGERDRWRRVVLNGEGQLAVRYSQMSTSGEEGDED
jgi:hypothetical protein